MRAPRLGTAVLLGASLAVVSDLTIPASLDAQEAPAARPEARAVRVTGRAPVLDGRLDDEVWSAAVPITNFTQKEPSEGSAATERTEVRRSTRRGTTTWP